MSSAVHSEAAPADVDRLRRAAFLIFLALAGTVLVPHVVAGGVAVGADDLATPVLLLGLSLSLIMHIKRPLAPATIVVAFLWLAIVVHGVFMGIASSAQYLGEASLPTEMWQYVKRLAFFYAAFALAASGPEAIQSGYKGIAVALLIACIIGALQIGSAGIGEALAPLYARTDTQLEHLVERELSTRRTYGVAGNSGAWGGFCMFMASVALPFVLTRAERTEHEEQGSSAWRVVFAMLLILAAINLLFSASRGPLAAFVLVLLMKGLLEIAVRRGGFRAFAKWLAWAAAMSAAAFYFAIDRLALLAYRFLTLADQRGGVRVDQVTSAMGLIDSPSIFLSGVGNAAQRALSVSHGVEVEPVYIVVNYGLIGAVCRYGLLFVIGICALRLMRRNDKWESAVGMAAFLALCGYAVFSVSYFFFQELYVGTVPWLIFGMVAGMYQRIWLSSHRMRIQRADAHAHVAS